MNSAIVIGGNGLIGRSLVAELAKRHTLVTVVGTADTLHKDIAESLTSKVNYVRARFGEHASQYLEADIREVTNLVEGSTFYNLAWRGGTALVDGDIASQLANVEMCCSMVKLAKRLGCNKYVTSGSMEELALSRHVNGKQWLQGRAQDGRQWYALAKLSAKMQSAFEAYNQKIDFCYTRLSIVIDKKLRTPKFVEQSLKNLLTAEPVPAVKNNELCNISSAEEIARQLIAVAEKGKNNQTYVLGTGESNTLRGYFNDFANLCAGDLAGGASGTDLPVEDSLLVESDFKTSALAEDTGYAPLENSRQLFLEVTKNR